MLMCRLKGSSCALAYLLMKGESHMNLQDALPFLIPLAVAELVLLFITLRHILTHMHYKRGTRTLWLIVAIVGMEFIGHILYFLLGKED